ncbi:MAG TPA: plastocyanin/azurin family copper-binding protein [Gemmatimonadaceae bacterium]|jgi:plastocyanin|nr:plastocyanin/azurin family copper-binding protein [Gemmatimonadaceae bacterium]
MIWRTIVVGSACTIAMMACGGEPKAADTGMAATSAAPAATADTSATAMAPAGSTGAAAAAGSAAAKPATGKTWDVKMQGDAQGYRFDPANITIKAGDAVRWTVVDGPPHNVAFWADSIPKGAEAQLQANMPNTMGPLSSPLEMNPNATYTVSFAGVPAGTYKYYCTPHLAMGMKGSITVQ